MKFFRTLCVLVCAGAVLPSLNGYVVGQERTLAGKARGAFDATVKKAKILAIKAKRAAGRALTTVENKFLDLENSVGDALYQRQNNDTWQNAWDDLFG